MNTPACMTDAEAAGWRAAALDASYTAGVPIPATPCADCHPAWSREMRAGGRCDGVPGTRGDPRTATERQRERDRAYQAMRRRARLRDYAREYRARMKRREAAA